MGSVNIKDVVPVISTSYYMSKGILTDIIKATQKEDYLRWA